jgi:hypothetical protein
MLQLQAQQFTMVKVRTRFLHQTEAITINLFIVMQ